MADIKRLEKKKKEKGKDMHQMDGRSFCAWVGKCLWCQREGSYSMGGKMLRECSMRARMEGDRYCQGA